MRFLSLSWKWILYLKKLGYFIESFGYHKNLSLGLVPIQNTFTFIITLILTIALWQKLCRSHCVHLIGEKQEGSIDLQNWKIQVLTKPNWIHDSQWHPLHVQHPAREGKYLAQDHHISQIRMGTAVSKCQILMLSHSFLWRKEKEAQSSLLRINFPLNYIPLVQWRFMSQCLAFSWYVFLACEGRYYLIHHSVAVF